MNGQNPYTAPDAPLVGGAPQDLPGSVSYGVLEALRATKPWVRFMGVLSGIGAGLMVLAGLAFTLSGLGGTRGLPAGLGIIYILLAGIYVVPTVYLNRYASRISDLLTSNSQEDLEEALRTQKSFWKYVGILTMIVMAIYFLIFIGAAVFAGVAASKRF